MFSSYFSALYKDGVLVTVLTLSYLRGMVIFSIAVVFFSVSNTKYRVIFC